MFFGIDNNLLTARARGHLLVPYRPAALSSLDRRYDLDASHRLSPSITARSASTTTRRGSPITRSHPPDTLDDLARPAYRRLLVVENPATSTPGLAFLLATIARYGENGWRAYWRELRANKVLVTDGWEDAYEQRFSGAAGSKGNRPIVVSYASSPPGRSLLLGQEARAAPPPASSSPAASARSSSPASCAERATRQGRGQLIDFLLSPAFRPTCPCRCSSSRCAEGVAAARGVHEVRACGATPARPAGQDRSARNRDRWIREWTNTVIR